jgi:hypothetical protein
MIGQHEPRFQYRRQLLALGMVTLMLLSLAWLKPVTQNAGKDHATAVNRLPKKTYAIEPMSVRVENPLFNPIFFLNKPLKAELKKKITVEQALAAAETDHPSSDNSFAEFIPPLVDGALGQASIALEQLSKANVAEKFRLNEMSKQQMADEVNADINQNRKEEVQKSLKNVDQDIKKAQQEISRMRNRTTAELMADKKRMEKDLAEAMVQLKSLGLDKLVKQSLDLAALSFKNMPSQKIKPRIKDKLKKDLELKEEEETATDLVPEKKEMDDMQEPESQSPAEPSLISPSLQSPMLLDLNDADQARILSAIAEKMMHAQGDMKRAIFLDKDSVRIRIMPVLLRAIKRVREMDLQRDEHMHRIRITGTLPKIPGAPVTEFIAQ